MADRHGPEEAHLRHLVGFLRGRVLEIGAGSGRNQALLSRAATWIPLEPDRRRHRQLAARLAPDTTAEALLAGAEQIPLATGSVDAVLAVKALCSVGDPGRALQEVRRVLRPGGRLVFLEHVDAPAGTRTHRALRLIAPLSRRLDHGCDPTRDTEALIRRSGLLIDDLRRYSARQPFGIHVPHILGVAVRV